MSATDTGGPKGPENRRRARRLPKPWAYIALPLCAVTVTLGLPLASPLFPEQDIRSCTVKDSLRERRVLLPKIHSDCEAFISGKDVECTSDSETELTLIPGYTYDFVVRGARIPFITSPVIVSASVSAEQRRQLPVAPSSADPSRTQTNEALEKLADTVSPETLRAFDYEQPPFDPRCDVSRMLMTSQGLQQVSPVRAEHLLAVPEGVAPRDTKLPCEGFQCGDPSQNGEDPPRDPS